MNGGAASHRSGAGYYSTLSICLLESTQKAILKVLNDVSPPSIDSKRAYFWIAVYDCKAQECENEKVEMDN